MYAFLNLYLFARPTENQSSDWCGHMLKEVNIKSKHKTHLDMQGRKIQAGISYMP